MSEWGRSVALLFVVVALASAGVARAQDIHVVDVPLVTSAQIHFARLPWPSTRVLVRQVVQDDFGFLWLSAPDGLRRYDGYGFMRVPDRQNPGTIGLILASSVMKDRSGRIRIGADDSLGRYDPATGSFTQYRSPDAKCGTVAFAHDIREDPDGLVWLATDDGITALDPSTSRTTCYRPRNDPSTGETRVIATLPARDGTLWITSSAGLFTLDRRSGKVTRHDRLETSAGRRVRPVHFLPGVAVNAGAYYVGRRFVNNFDQASIPGDTIFNVRARYATSIARRQATFQVYVENLTDQRYWSAAGGGLLAVGMPRTLKVSARVDL